MQNTKTESTESRPIGAVLQELLNGLQNLFRSETRLFKVEIQDTLRQMTRQLAIIAVCGMIAIAGTLPILAFLVIGLGKVLGDNYWLSSLLVGMFCIVIGSIVGYLAYRKIDFDRLSLPHTRSSLVEEKEMFRDEFQKVTNIAKRRPS